MKITIVGTGNVGGRLGRAWASKGHDVVFAVRDPSDPKARSAVEGARVEAVDAALRDGEVVVLAIPFAAVADVLERAPAMTGKILIDCTNPVGVALPSGVGSGAELVATLAPGARVVKSFNARAPRTSPCLAMEMRWRRTSIVETTPLRNRSCADSSWTSASIRWTSAR